MELLSFLQELGTDSNPGAPGFQPKSLYLLMCVALPVAVGLFVGGGLKVVERIFGIEIGRRRR